MSARSKIIFQSILFLFYSLITSQLSFSQSSWKWQSPIPHGDDYVDFAFINENTGFSISANGNLFKTTNAGNNWNQLTFYAILVNNIQIFNENVLIVTTNSVFYKSTDGGLSWISRSGIAPIIRSSYFINENTGYIGGSDNIYKTTDGGNNWLNINVPSVNIIRKIVFVNENTGIAVANTRIIKTTNAGNNWSVVYSTTVNTSGTLKFFNENTGYATTSNGLVLKTTNAGTNWFTINLSANILSISGLSSDYIMACGTGGLVAKSTDGGANWTSLSLNLSEQYNCITMLDSNNIIVGGSDGELYKTTNGGLNWTLRPGVLGNLRSNFFININTGFVVGAEGAVLKTTNQGKQWSIVNVNDTINFFDIHFINDQIGYLSSGLYLYKTTNQGNNWEFINNIGLERIWFFNENEGVGGYVGTVFYKTTNGGLNWTQTASFSQYGTVTEIQFVNDLTGFSSNGTGRFLKTTNRGDNWSVVSTSPSGGVSNMDFINENTGYYAKGLPHNIFMKTTDGGNTWVNESLNLNFPNLSNFQIDYIDFANSNTGYINCLFLNTVTNAQIQTVIRTTNGGLNWDYDFVNTNQSVLNMKVLSADVCFIFGANGMIYARTDNLTNVSNTLSLINSFSLNQNYPNPFNPETNISFNIASRDFVRLSVFNILGQEIEVLENTFLDAGIHNYKWKGTGFPSGVYFYKITTSQYSQTKKMMLLK